MSCTTTKKNLGKSKCDKLPAQPQCMIETGNDFKLLPADFASEAALKTALQAAIKAGYATRIWLWPVFTGVENLSEEAIYEDTPLSLVPVRDGQYRFRFHISKNMAIHKAMFTHRSINEGRVFLFDKDNQLFGTEDVDGNIRGFRLALLHTEKLMFSDGAVATKSPVYVCLADNEEVDKNGVLLDASVINELDRLTDVNITLVDGDAFAADEFYVNVKQATDGTPVSGLLTADFIKYAADGVTTEALTATEDVNNPGRYLIAATVAFTDGELTLRAPSLLTVSAYEVPADGVLEVDIP